MFAFCYKSWVLPALFFVSFYSFSSENVFVNKALLLKLDQNKQWHSLLHIKNDKPQIYDKKFTLSSPQFSSKLELEKTIRLIISKPEVALCQFPARYVFLQKYLNLKKANFSNCSELTFFLKKVPFNSINLIFASEVISSASSMMGHVFLNTTGLNDNNDYVSHSISFFTEFSSFNPASLIYDGLIGGMPGFLNVRPFSKDYERYLYQEKRNIWSYKLKISAEDKYLIQLHIWELKNIDIEYLFQSYNCATLTLDLLSIADPKLKQEEKLFVSPIDVVKAVKKHYMVKSKLVSLSDDWKLAMLQQEIDNETKLSVENAVFHQNRLSFLSYDAQRKMLALEYLSLLLKSNDIKKKLPSERFDELESVVKNYKSSQFRIDLTEYKDPAKSPQDSIVSLKLNSQSIDLSFLPASHYLYSDNRQFFSESELQIGKIVLRKNIHSTLFKLQELTLYSVKSYNPSSLMKKAVSGEFYLGYKHILDPNFKEVGVFELSGSFGKSYQLHNDVLFYGLLGFGGSINRAQASLFVAPHIGTIIQLINNSKFIFEHKYTLFKSKKFLNKQTTKLIFSWYGMKNKTINVSYKRDEIENINENVVSIQFDYNF